MAKARGVGKKSVCVSDFRLRIGVGGNVFWGTSWWLMARAKYISVWEGLVIMV